jgi:hypothetical protein
MVYGESSLSLSLSLSESTEVNNGLNQGYDHSMVSIERFGTVNLFYDSQTKLLHYFIPNLLCQRNDSL